MSRWRPPREQSAPYITPSGYTQLEDELASLWRKRRIVNDALSAAAKEGDRSENAEYIYRKKEQGEIDRRIRYLQKRLPLLNIVRSVADKERVFFGAYVTVCTTSRNDLSNDLSKTATATASATANPTKSTKEYRIVGPDETDANLNFISVDSPLARALLKKQVGDEVAFLTEKGHQSAIIKRLRY